MSSVKLPTKFKTLFLSITILAMSATPSSAKELTQKVLQNLSYSEHKLVDGNYRGTSPYDDGVVDAVLSSYLTGKTQQNGEQYAAVFIYEVLNGTGRPQQLYIVKSTTNGEVLVSPYSYMCDRCNTEILKITNKSVTISVSPSSKNKKPVVKTFYFDSKSLKMLTEPKSDFF